MRPGDKYGRLTVIAEAGRSKHNRRRIRCACDCGKEVVVMAGSLKTGNTKSCGCYWLEVVKKKNSTHQMTGTGLYNSWRAMKERCLNPNSSSYPNYGGRGITICNDWLKFKVFRRWATAAGYRKGLSIERVNNDGPYCPENCTWGTRMQQSNNRRNNHTVEFNGETKSIAEWSRQLNINYRTLQDRLARGWPPEKALLTPPGAVKPGPKPKSKPVYIAEK